MAVTTGGSTAFLAAEYLIKRIGEEAAAQVVIAPVVWQESLVNLESMVAHFRFLNSLTMAAATEGNQLPAVAWSPTGVTVTAATYGFYVQVTKAMNSISPDALSKIAQQGGTAAGRAIDTALASLFPSLTAGTVGTSGAALTLDMITTAVANLDSYFAIGQKYGFVHPHQWANLVTSIKGANYGISRITVDATNNEIMDIEGVQFRKTALVTTVNSAADFAGAILTEEALGLATAQQPLVEILDYPTYASWVVESTVAFGTGVIRPRFGCLVQSGVSA